MRIIVISDTHGNYNAIESVFMRNLDADWFIHLGDGENELDRFELTHPKMSQKILHVCGNCDLESFAPATINLPVPGHCIFITHGHRYSVKAGLDKIKQTAAENDCDIILFGHTHVGYNSYEDGMYILNPGSASVPRFDEKATFGCIDISDAGILMNIAEV